MFENLGHFFKRMVKTEQQKELGSKDAAKERLHLVLMQDRANVSADFLELMKQEIIDVIKKYIEVDEKEIDVRLTNDVKDDGTTSAPSLYANIPIMNIKNEMKKEVEEQQAKKAEEKKEDKEASNKEDEEKPKKENTEIKQEEKEVNNEETEKKYNQENNIEEDIAYEMPSETTYEIDEENDWKIVEELMKKYELQ